MLAVSFLTWIVESMIFFPSHELVWTPETFGLGYEDVLLEAGEDGETIHGWWIPAPGESAPVLLFFHGNAGNIADRLPNVRMLHDVGLSVLIVDYRGYGRSEGGPGEEETYEDARAAWVWLTEDRGLDPGRIALFGRSLGGAVAIDLARTVRPRALVVESTFTSVPEMAPLALPIVPSSWVPDVYDSLAKIPEITCPTLVLHGTEDEIIPFAMGRRIFDALTVPKEFVAIEGAGHNDTVAIGGQPYVERIRDFVVSPPAGDEPA